MGERRADELRKLADLENASRGLYVSKTGKLPNTGGLLGRDYDEFPSLIQAVVGGLPRCIWINGKRKHYTYPYFVQLFAENGGKPLFIPSKKNRSEIKHGDYKGKKGFIIQYSPFLYPHDPREGTLSCERKKYLYFPEWDVVYNTK